MRIALGVIGLVATVSAAGAETCYVDPGGQFGKLTMCVSSVLQPQGANSYGPEHLIGRAENEGKAWCEGVAGPGIGETITEKLDGSYSTRALLITNGYAKSDEAFRGNGRIKSAVIETSRGYKATVDAQGYARAAEDRLPEIEDRVAQTHHRRRLSRHPCRYLRERVWHCAR
jgi:hypothetical protein